MTKEEIRNRAKKLYNNDITDGEIIAFFKSKNGYPSIIELENFIAKTENKEYQELLKMREKTPVLL